MALGILAHIGNYHARCMIKHIENVRVKYKEVLINHDRLSNKFYAKACVVKKLQKIWVDFLDGCVKIYYEKKR